LEFCVEIRLTPFSNFPTATKKSAKQTYAHFHSKKPKTSIHLIGITKKKASSLELNQTRSALKISSKVVPLREAEDKKGILLYQQIEKNKLFNNGNELVGRFHLKA